MEWIICENVCIRERMLFFMRYTDRQTDRQIDRQTDRYVGRRTDGHAVICLIRICQAKMNIPVMSMQFVYWRWKNNHHVFVALIICQCNGIFITPARFNHQPFLLGPCHIPLSPATVTRMRYMYLPRITLLISPQWQWPSPWHRDLRLAY